MSHWVVPGSPLLDGSGWRIWYATLGNQDYRPDPVRVMRGNHEMASSQTHESLGYLPALGRSICIDTVRMHDAVPGQEYVVAIPEAGLRKHYWRTLPREIPPEGVRFVFASCFWRNDDKEGHYFRAIDAAIKAEMAGSPAFKILAGDQIYLDFPVPLNPLASHEKKVAERYQEYWGDDAYLKVLQSAPNFFLCDDHEWWNDFPERQNHLPYTWRSDSRASYGQAATRYYEAFQRCLNPGNERWYQFDISPVSFFAADSRSARDKFDGGPAPRHFFQQDQWDALEAWQRNLRGPGILVTGMPLFQKDGDWKDHSLSNFPEDYRRFLKLIENSLAGNNAEGKRHDIVILSGDIHTGRHCIARPVNRPQLEVHELIASSASRVGPFVSEPEPSSPPDFLPDSATPRWGHVDTLFSTVENNIGLIRLFPSEKLPNLVRLVFVSLLVRPHRRPPWKFLRSTAEPGTGSPQGLRLYENEIHLR